VRRLDGRVFGSDQHPDGAVEKAATGTASQCPDDPANTAPVAMASTIANGWIERRGPSPAL